ncbi:putative leucine-rich repeat-containing protein DDB_G0290503 [Helianthus annuus]|uniref:putative leucine-rich repeat-containing protein DDB_G0290503 n=1 Tax=Helianthus annuus TaxID=4232 RepID=UPI001652D0EE|nr:putative leucine-rich repeat-containing protein DDB_G0290503 [Helianthus annuus]
MVSAVRRAQRFMEITGRKTIGGPSTKLGFDKSKVKCFKCKQKGHFKRECRNAYVEESENPFKDDYYKKAIYHQNKSEPPRIKQSEDNKGKSRALAVIYDDEGYDWSKEVLPEDDAIGYAFMASHNEPIQWKDNRTEQQKYEYRKMVAEAKIIRLSGVYEEAKRANRWDPDRECYLDEYGNIAVDYKKIDIEAIIQEYKEEDEYWQHKWWGTPTSKMIEEEREKERREKEKIEEPVKIDTGLINTAQEMTAENLREMADKVLAVKALEVDSTPNSESKKQVSQTKSSTVSVVDGIVSVEAETTVDDDDKQSAMGRGKDTNKGHNVPSAIDEVSTKGTEAEKMAECLRKSRIAKALSDTTIVYESHVRRFWDTARFEEKDNKIHAVVKKKDENNKDIDVEVVFGVEDIRRVLDLQDSDNDPTIMSERLAKGLWCRLGFSSHINGKMFKRKPQRKLIDEPVIEPREVVDKGVGLEETLESYFKKHEEAEQAQAQKKVGQEEEAQKNSSNEDSEETLSESELVKETVGKGKVQLKKRPLKKRKNSEDEDSPYNPEDSQKNRKKRKATRTGDIPRVVRAKKQNAKSQKEKEGKKKQDTAETSPVVEIPKEVPLTEIPIETQTSYDDYVEITGVKSAKQTSDRHDIPESSQRKTDYFNLDFDSFGGATGDFFKDMPESEGDLFHDKKMKELEEKVKALEKEKEENEAVQIKLKEMIDELEKRHEDVMDAVFTKDEKLNEMKEDIKDNAELISALTDEIAALNAKVKDLQNINQTLNQLLNEMNEASTNEMKAMKLEMEAMRADKVMKDKQLEMLTAVIEAHLKVNIHEAFDQVDIIKANERRKERERQLAEEANLKNKGIAEEVEVVGSSQNQLEVGGSSSQPEIEMVNAQDVTVNDEEMVEAENEAVHEPEFIMVGESVEPIIPENVLRDIQIIQRKKKAKEVLLLEYSTDKFVLVGKAYRVPYSEEESAKLLRFFELKDQGKIARGEVEEESDSDFWEEEDEDDDKDDKADDKSDDDDKPDDDDDDQGTSGLLINDPSVQDKVNELMNDEVNEQNDDAECEGSSSGNQSGDQVHQLTSTFISLSEYHQGEVDIIRTRAEMLEELGLEDGKFKFDIED